MIDGSKTVVGQFRGGIFYEVNTPTVVNPRRVIPAKVETGRDDDNPDGKEEDCCICPGIYNGRRATIARSFRSYFKEMIAKMKTGNYIKSMLTTELPEQIQKIEPPLMR